MELGLLDHVEQRGKVEGQRDMLREHIEVRFGPLSPVVIARLQSWPGDRLTELGRALLSATSLEGLGLGESLS